MNNGSDAWNCKNNRHGRAPDANFDRHGRASYVNLDTARHRDNWKHEIYSSVKQRMIEEVIRGFVRVDSLILK